MSFKNIIILCLTVVLLVSCAGGHRGSDLTLSAQEYLQLASTAQSSQRNYYLLLAARRFLETHQTKTAQHILDSLQSANLTPEQAIELRLLRAQTALLKGNSQATINILQPLLATPPQAQQQQMQLATILAHAYASIGNVAASLEQRQQLLKLADDNDQRQQVIAQTWLYLQSLDVSELDDLQNVVNPITQGWYQLIIIAQQTQWNDQQLLLALQNWRSKFPNHPANTLLAKNLSIQELTYQRPTKISLLLPLTGTYSQAGNAIRNGFFAAYYAAGKNKTQQLAKVEILNTANKPIQDTYASALQNGSDFIIGPLTKPNLQQLISSNYIRVPTLALNSLPNVDQPLLIQFSLSPMDEAEQVAEFAWSQHHQRALIISTDSSRGKDVLQALTKDWQDTGGDVVATWLVSAKYNINATMQKILLVDQSRQRKSRIQAIIGSKVRFHVRRRQDVDVVLLATTPVLARQIQPLMKYYLAGNIPIYATSQIYTGYPNPTADRDLDGVFFCDSPWILAPTPQNDPRLAAIEKQLETLWPTDFKKYRRFFAMGIDAYDLSSRLNRLLLLPRIGWAAANGNLFLNTQHRIYRQLIWARFINGRPQRLNN